MADIADVGDALVNLIDNTLYPAGPDGDGAYALDVAIYRGWPDPAALDADLATTPDSTTPARLHVSVWPLAMERDTTRYPMEWQENARPVATYSAAILGNTITISGAPPDPYIVHNVGAGIGGHRHALVYTAVDGDTAGDIATALAALIAPVAPGTAALGADIIVPQPYIVQFARVGVIGDIIREVARSEKGFQVTIWANNDANRQALARVLEPVLAAAIRLDMPDGSSAHLTRRGSSDIDGAERQGAYRRDLVYSIEYALTQSATAPEIIAVETEVKDPTGAVIAESLE